MLDVVVIGQTERPLLRSTARAGDEIWVTGRLGGSAAAVSAWRSGQEPNQKARARYAHPLPRIREALWLRERVELHALIDLSDGLHGDVAHIAAASNCRVTIEAAALPIDESAGADMRSAVGGGEDFELCLTAEAGAIESIRAEFEREMKLPLTRVGNITAGSGVWQRESDGTVQLVESGGFQHFQGYR
jgi:thiamine-monophosphate kinase